MSDGLMAVFLLVIIIIGAVVLFLVTQGKKGSSVLDVERYRRSWLQIENQLMKEHDSSYQLVIMNADKLLDRALKERGFKGDTMAERMKSASDVFSSANNVWTAHKHRNRFAHETDASISYADTRRSLAAYKQALKDVQAI